MEKLYQSCADGAKDPMKPAAPIVRCCHYAIMWATLLGWPTLPSAAVSVLVTVLILVLVVVLILVPILIIHALFLPKRSDGIAAYLG